MNRWLAFPYDAAGYRYGATALRARWAALHAGDAEPLPRSARLLDAWAQFHAGNFEAAARAGLALGNAGVVIANAAQLVYANYLENSEPAKLALLMEVAERAQRQSDAQPALASAHYQLGCALGRYAQGIPVARALSEGLVDRTRAAFERAIALAPRHADAHFALAALHADVIDKVGALLGRSHSASRKAGIALFRAAMRLHAGSIAGRLAYATGLLMLEGEQQMGEATALYQAAAAGVPLDACERLEMESAKAALRD